MSILFSWLSPLRTICMAIDGIAFSLLDDAYNIIVKLASATLLEHDTIRKITNSLYILFGVVAFFRLALLLVNSVIDPEKLNEKGKGLGNIFFRVVGMIVILAVTPIIFNFSYEVQKMMVGAKNEITGNKNYGNVVFKVFLGDNANISGSDEDGYNAGKELQNIVLSSLITIDDRYLVNNGATCTINDDGKTVDSSGKVLKTEEEVNKKCGYIPLTCVSDSKDSKTCTMQGGYIYDGSDGKCDWKNCHNAVDAYNEMYVNEDMSPNKLASYVGTSTDIKDGDTEEEVYVYDYMFIVTGVAGIAMTWMLFSFAIDIAVRMFELIVLEVLSPLFIATFVDPKSTQSGPFKNWLSAIGKSYAALYIRLAILALMTLLIMIVNQSDMFNNMGDVSGWAKLFVIIGLLIFAKKAPKWIGDILGLKGDGLGGLGIGKKLGGMALAGGLATKGVDALKKGGRAVGGAALSRLGGTAAARRLKRDQQKRQGSLRDAYKEAYKDAYKKDHNSGAARRAALGTYFKTGASRMRDRAKAGIVGGQSAAMEGLKKGAQTKNAAEMAGLFGQTYKNMTAEAGHEGLGAKINARFDEMQGNIKANAIGSPSDLRELRENSEKIAKANKLRNSKIELDSDGKRKGYDFQNQIEMNKAIKLANDKGFKLKGNPITENDVYAADMVNHGLMTNIERGLDGSIIKYKDRSGNTISGEDVAKNIENYGKEQFSMAGRDQIKLDCAKNASELQEQYINAEARVKELDKQSAEFDVNLAKLNTDRTNIMKDSAMASNVSVSFTHPNGTTGTINRSAAEVYELYSNAVANGNNSLASVLSNALKTSVPNQFLTLSSIDNSIASVNLQKSKIEANKTAWQNELDDKENMLVNLCEQYTGAAKDNPIANADFVTIVGSYDENGMFIRDSDASKIYDENAARQNTQFKLGKLEEKAKKSLEDSDKKDGKK